MKEHRNGFRRKLAKRGLDRALEEFFAAPEVQSLMDEKFHEFNELMKATSEDLWLVEVKDNFDFGITNYMVLVARKFKSSTFNDEVEELCENLRNIHPDWVEMITQVADSTTKTMLAFKEASETEQ